MPDLQKNKFIVVGEEKIYLKQCDENLKYLFGVLQEERIPFEHREEIANSVMIEHFNIKTQLGRHSFVLFIVFMIICILFTNSYSSFYLMMKSLVKAIQEGKITKPIA